jgi:hypothetical protein
MKTLTLMAATAMVFIGSAACAQSTDQAVVGPTDRGTGPIANPAPSRADTRQLDQDAAVPPANNTAPGQTQSSDMGNTSWRASNGFNSDPNNPNGAPGPSTIGTSPSR